MSTPSSLGPSLVDAFSSAGSPGTSRSSASPPPLGPSSPRQPHSPVDTPEDEGTGALDQSVPALHQAAQLNDLSYLDSHALTHSDVNLRDSQRITALHWASINGHFMFVKRLLALGAEIDTKGGELDATPLMWAARNGHTPVVHLLLQHGSDPTLTDSQSFNVLHLAVHSSSPFLIAYLLFTSSETINNSVDTPDQQGHTSLAWACYQGDAISVELLLKAGASPTRTDDAGLTPLHWAVTKGNAACIKRIVEAGAELEARDDQGKTARDMSIELKNFGSYKRALIDCGKDEFGQPEDKPFASDVNTKRVIFWGVVIALGVIAKTFALVESGWVGTILVAAEVYAVHTAVTKVLLGVKTPSQSDRITKSNYLMSLISASLIWVGWVWISRNLREGQGGWTNLSFAMAFAICCVNFWRSVTLDPGYVPHSPTDLHLKSTIERLVEEGKFNGMNFCLTCLVKRPLRSKHSYATGRCVGRFDHYCPWVWNDVGVNNHRQFLLFITSLVVGILLFVRLQIAHFSRLSNSTLPSHSDDATSSCSLLPSPICAAFEQDSFAFAITGWASLQLTWTVVLLGVQIWQVCRQITTLEVSNLGRYGYMGGKPGISAPHQQGAVAKFQLAQAQAEQHRLNSNGTAGDSDSPSNDPSSLSHAPSRTSSKPSGAFGFLLKLLGLDRFTASHKALLHRHNHADPRGRNAGDGGGRDSNPFDLGVWKNCLDFWTKGGQLRVDWIDPDLEIPPGGFKGAQGNRSRRPLMGSTGETRYERVQLEEV